MGRPRIDESEKVKTVHINLKQKVIEKIAKEGKPKHVIERIINELYNNDK